MFDSWYLKLHFLLLTTIYLDLKDKLTPIQKGCPLIVFNKGEEKSVFDVWGLSKSKIPTV